MNSKEENITYRKMLNIKNMLVNSENIGIETCNQLNLQSEKLKITHKKSYSIYDKLLLSRDKINKMTLSIPSFNIKLPFSTKEKNTNDNKNILFNEMDEITNRLNTLKNIAIDINSHLESQNIIIDKISINQNNSIKIISENNYNIKKLL
jgi:hypothetical protein